MPTKTSKKKKPARTKKALTRKPAAKKKSVKKTAPLKKAAPKKKKALKKNKVRGKSQGVDSVVFEPKGLGSRSGGQSGDLQGLSNRESADSESVGELLEEGNAFEAGVVSGVEEAGRRGEREVHTREVPEDDVPGEYLDQD